LKSNNSEIKNLTNELILKWKKITKKNKEENQREKDKDKDKNIVNVINHKNKNESIIKIDKFENNNINNNNQYDELLEKNRINVK
jgi:hypothetical protein